MTQETKLIYGDEDSEACLKQVISTRHRAVQDACRFFVYTHLPVGLPRIVSRLFCVIATSMLNAINVDDPELTHGLNRLKEAKDCMVRAAFVSQERSTEHDH